MSDNEKDKKNSDQQKEKKKPPPPPVESQHQIELNGQTLRYTARAGLMPLKDEKDDEIEASIFFTSYTLNDVDSQADRPLTFVFNGGPGSASVWLHMGAIGPKRVKMQHEGWMPPPPYRLENNAHTWLDITDLVFIDPVGTGFSRAVKEDDNKNYWSVEGDIKSLTQFIRLYLTHYQRWTSPLYLTGESYGTTRSAGLAESLHANGIGLSGILLISTVLNFQSIEFVRGNDLPFNLYIPTYAATAWYHRRLDERLKSKSLPGLLEEVEAWSMHEYALALMKGDSISDEERETIVEKLSYYTGLDRAYIDDTKLRIDIQRFCKELLRDEHRTVGRLDSRFKGYEDLKITEFPEFDPSMTAITPPYTATFNQYVREQLRYETDVAYNILSYDVNENWEWEKGKFPDTSDLLRKAMQRNPFMRVLVAQGYYDLATPHLGALYTFNHMGLGPELHQNVEYHFYEAGHMFYLDVASLAKFKTDVSGFYAGG